MGTVCCTVGQVSSVGHCNGRVKFEFNDNISFYAKNCYVRRWCVSLGHYIILLLVTMSILYTFLVIVTLNLFLHLNLTLYFSTCIHIILKLSVIFWLQYKLGTYGEACTTFPNFMYHT